MKTYVDEATRDVTFLYQLTDGYVIYQKGNRASTDSACSCSPKSYGPHVASLAGVPRNIVERAIDVSSKFEARTLAHQAKKQKDQALALDLQGDCSYRESKSRCTRADSLTI